MGSECQQQYFELNSIVNGKPVKILQERSCMAAFSVSQYEQLNLVFSEVYELTNLFSNRFNPGSHNNELI